MKKLSAQHHVPSVPHILSVMVLLCSCGHNQHLCYLYQNVKKLLLKLRFFFCSVSCETEITDGLTDMGFNLSPLAKFFAHVPR